MVNEDVYTLFVNMACVPTNCYTIVPGQVQAIPKGVIMSTFKSDTFHQRQNVIIIQVIVPYTPEMISILFSNTSEILL